MALIGTAGLEITAFVRPGGFAMLSVDPGTIATGTSSFTINVPPTFVNGYPVAVIPISNNDVDGAAVSFNGNATMAIISTSISNGVVTVNTANSGAGADPGVVLFAIIQLDGESFN